MVKILNCLILLIWLSVDVSFANQKNLSTDFSYTGIKQLETNFNKMQIPGFNNQFDIWQYWLEDLANIQKKQNIEDLIGVIQAVIFHDFPNKFIYGDETTFLHFWQSTFLKSAGLKLERFAPNYIEYLNYLFMYNSGVIQHNVSLLLGNFALNQTVPIAERLAMGEQEGISLDRRIEALWVLRHINTLDSLKSLIQIRKKILHDDNTLNDKEKLEFLYNLSYIFEDLYSNTCEIALY